MILKLESSDLDAIFSILAPPGQLECLRDLAQDPDTLRDLLEDIRLRQYVFEDAELGTNSSFKITHPKIHFYVSTRYLLRRAGLDYPLISEYLAEILTHFLNNVSWGDPQAPWTRPPHYLQELIHSALAAENQEHAHLTHVHIGNYSLFLAGLCPQYIDEVSNEHDWPGLEYYERTGKQGYLYAAASVKASDTNARQLFSDIAENFSLIRESLNRLLVSPLLSFPK